MGSIFNSLKQTFKQGNIVTQLLYINVTAFALIALFVAVALLFKIDNTTHFVHHLYLPADLSQLTRRPWALLTYMFFHSDGLHLIGNMLWLYWFGKLFLYFFSSKHLRGLYVLGGLSGALLYIAAYNIFPYFQDKLYSASLVGASAAVLAIAMAIVAHEPEYRINLLFVGAIRLKYLALIIVLFDILYIGSSNAGGHIAHLGGALAGWCFAKAISQGRDITHGINVSIDFIGKLFCKRERKPKMKVHVNNSRKTDYDYNANKKAKSDEIDRILEKLKVSGYESLTNNEKHKLFDASKR